MVVSFPVLAKVRCVDEGFDARRTHTATQQYNAADAAPTARYPPSVGCATSGQRGRLSKRCTGKASGGATLLHRRGSGGRDVRDRREALSDGPRHLCRARTWVLPLARHGLRLTASAAASVYALCIHRRAFDEDRAHRLLGAGLG